jgi:hypothetical protein
MKLDRNEVLQRFCKLAADVREHLTNELKGREPYSYSADCFCDSPSEVTSTLQSSPFGYDYCFDEPVMQFIEEAVNQALAERT